MSQACFKWVVERAEHFLNEISDESTMFTEMNIFQMGPAILKWYLPVLNEMYHFHMGPTFCKWGDRS